MTQDRELERFKEELGISEPVEIKEVDLATVNETLRRYGTAPVHAVFPKRVRQFYISNQAEIGLQAIAARENLYIRRGSTIGQPSISELMECIGLGLYRVVPTEGAPQS